MIAEADIVVVRGLQQEMIALGNRLKALTAGNPEIHCDPFILARGQLNSAIRYIEMGLLKASAAPSEPAAIG